MLLVPILGKQRLRLCWPSAACRMFAAAADLYDPRLLRVLAILAAVFSTLRYEATASRMCALLLVLLVCHDGEPPFATDVSSRGCVRDKLKASLGKHQGYHPAAPAEVLPGGKADLGLA